MDEANLAELKVALNGFLAKGETIKLETKVRVAAVLTFFFLRSKSKLKHTIVLKTFHRTVWIL